MAFPGAEGVPSNININNEKPKYTEFYTDFQIPTVKQEADIIVLQERETIEENLPVSQNWVG